MKRLVIAGAAVLALGVLSMTIGGTASAGGVPTAVPVFDDAAQQVTLTIPNPPCAEGQDSCKWMLFVNEPDVAGKPVVGTVLGTSGVLTIHYPADFCGVLQADARTGPPWVQVRGVRHTVSLTNCPSAATSTTTTTTTTTTSIPPNVSNNSGEPPKVSPTDAPVADAPVVAATSSTPSTAPTSATTPTSLPFTGVDTGPLWLIGLALTALGLTLLSTASLWRVRLRRAVGAVVETALGPDPQHPRS